MLALLTPDRTGLTVSDLAAATQLRTSNITMGVDVLESGALAERRFPERDKRTVRVYLTEKGRAKAESMHAALASYAQNVATAAQTQET